MKILFPVDGSDYSLRAAHFLVAHLAWFKTYPELHLLHVKLPIPPGLALTRAAAVLGDNVVDQYYAEEAGEAMAGARAVLDAHRIPFQVHWCVGDVATEISRHAGELGAELIVMGSHGHGAFRNLVLGSVTTKVLASETAMPVLIVR